MIARFVKGNRKLDLTTGAFTPMDVVPPASVSVPNIATGTGLDPLAGGVKVGEQAQNREWSMRVRVLASSAAAVRAGVHQIQAFVADDEGLFFEYSPLDLPEPLWGQVGAVLRYEVVHADAPILWPEWSIATAQSQGAVVEIPLILAPHALGTRNRAASASGAVWEDCVGLPDGVARGLRVLPAGTQKVKNPVFGHSSWDTGWTASANMSAVLNTTDPRYCWPGSPASVFLTARGANATYTETIDPDAATTHYMTAYVMRRDGEAVTASDCQIWYASARASTYTHVGNGVYCVQYSGSVADASNTYGLYIPPGRGLYLLGFVLDTAPTMILFHGDMLGGAWAGTPFESATTRTAGKVKVTLDINNFNLAQGAVHITWKTDYASTATGDRYFFSCAATSFRAYFNATNDTIVFTDNTNTATSAAQTFSAGDVIDLLFTWGSGGLAVYKNGSSIATNATYTPPAMPTALYLATDASGANPCDGVLMAFDIYGDDLTSTQAGTLYSYISAATAGGARAEPILLYWTKDGDDKTDNAEDATYDDWGAIMGVGGDAPADAYISTERSPAPVPDGAYFAVWPQDQFIPPSYLASAGAGTVSVTTSAAALGTVAVGSNWSRHMLDMEWCAVVRLVEAGANNLSMRLNVNYADGHEGYYNQYEVTSWIASPDTSIDSTRFIPCAAKEYEKLVLELVGKTSARNFIVQAQRAAGTANVTVSMIQLLPRPLSIMRTNDAGEPRNTGDELLPLPGKVNVYFSLFGLEGASSTASEEATTTVYVTPRYELL